MWWKCALCLLFNQVKTAKLENEFLIMHRNFPKNYISFICKTIWYRLCSSLLIIASGMVIEYEIVCIWITVAKAILLLHMLMVSACVSELGRILQNINKVVYIMLCIFLSVCNHQGSCSARSFIYVCLNVFLNQSGIMHLFKALCEYRF